MTGSTPEAWQQVSPSATITPVPTQPLPPGVGNLISEMLVYAGTGDGTPNVQTFQGKPRTLIFMSPTSPALSTSPIVGDDATIFVTNGGAGGAPVASSLYSSQNVDIDALNTLFTASIPDINKAATAYYVFAIEEAV